MISGDGDRRDLAVRLTRSWAGALACAVVACGCSFHHDVGDSSTAQLCDVFDSELEGRNATLPFSVVDLIGELAADPRARPPATLAIAVAYNAKKDAYRELGPFRPAIEYLARAGARRAGESDPLPAPSEDVRRSAQVADEAIADSACAS